ncbi:MAG: hypothetical protein VX210_15545 [Myxococcota bacterium]|nr:hypothetical protein [Myxococcota bacterium]
MGLTMDPLAAGIAGVLDAMYRGFDRQEGEERLLRLLKLEVVENIKLLEVANLDRETGFKNDDPYYREIASRVQYKAHQAVYVAGVFINEELKVRDNKNSPKLKIQTNPDGTCTDIHEMVSVHEFLDSFCGRGRDLQNRLAIPDDNEAMPLTYFATRLKNVLANELSLLSFLMSLPLFEKSTRN